MQCRGVTGFYGTDLAPILRAMGVDTVILTGVSTNIALVGMAIEAINRSFSVVLPEDCTVGASAETHEHTIRHTLPVLANVVHSDDILGHWSM